jgi:hypothetical protein
MPDQDNKTGLLKFIIPGIVVALFAYQSMQSQPQPEQARTPQNPEQQDPRNPGQGNPQNPEQQDPQNPGQQDPQNSGLSPLFGTWKGDGSNGNGQFVAIFNFQPNGTFEIQQMNTGNNGTSLEAVISGSYKRTGQNSYVFLPEKRCDGRSCAPGGEPKVFTLTSPNEILFNGITFRKIS